MTKLLIDIELAVPDKLFNNLVKLSKEFKKSVPDTVFLCLEEKCNEYLDMFKNNVPDEEKE